MKIFKKLITPVLIVSPLIVISCSTRTKFDVNIIYSDQKLLNENKDSILEGTLLDEFMLNTSQDLIESLVLGFSDAVVNGTKKEVAIDFVFVDIKFGFTYTYEHKDDHIHHFSKIEIEGDSISEELLENLKDEIASDNQYSFMNAIAENAHLHSDGVLTLSQAINNTLETSEKYKNNRNLNIVIDAIRGQSFVSNKSLDDTSWQGVTLSNQEELGATIGTHSTEAYFDKILYQNGTNVTFATNGIVISEQDDITKQINITFNFEIGTSTASITKEITPLDKKFSMINDILVGKDIVTTMTLNEISDTASYVPVYDEYDKIDGRLGLTNVLSSIDQGLWDEVKIFNIGYLIEKEDAYIALDVVDITTGTKKYFYYKVTYA